MPFPLNLIHPRSDDYDSSSSNDSTQTAKSSSRNNNTDNRTLRSPYVATTSSQDSLMPPPAISGRSSASSSATSTPIPSRSASPLPQFYSVPSSTYTSDADSEPNSPLLARNRKSRSWLEDRRRWWVTGSDGRRRRRRRESCFAFRSFKRAIRTVIRHPLFPTQPTSIILTLFLLTIFAILLTLLLIHILNPDKEPLPWRAYCSIPSTSTSPPSLDTLSVSPSFPFNTLSPSDLSSLSSLIPPPFPPSNLDSLPPAGVLLGVFSMDSAIERRMLVRSTWASHTRSRNGAGLGDGGLGTSRTVVRFVLGQPRRQWERRIELEAETYNDMIVLPIGENMNSGKTHAFFTWAADDAWVPPPPANASAFAATTPRFSYTNATNPVPVSPAPHDPPRAPSDQPRPWVRPDFVVKVDDDSFVMLAELEARLRVELYTKARNLDDDAHLSVATSSHEPKPDLTAVMFTPSPSHLNSTATAKLPLSSLLQTPDLRPYYDNDDPLVYWGYLVKNQFMAGELYGLSWSLVSWVASDAGVRNMIRGKEDKQVAKWMRAHPRAHDVRWKSERCWIYDHPRAGTVYSHGFLFPSEVMRIRKSITSYLIGSETETPAVQAQASAADPADPSPLAPIPESSTPSSWAHSSVSTFGVRYTPPVPDLTALQSVEALVEGAAMSALHEGGAAPSEAWAHREGRAVRYEARRVGGTVVVHFIKKNPWFLETALALLEGAEVTDMEARRQDAARAMKTSGRTRALALHRRR